MTFTINFSEPNPPYEDAIYYKPDGTIMHYRNGKWQSLFMSNTNHPKPFSESIDPYSVIVTPRYDFETDFGTFDNESPALPPIPRCYHENRTKQIFRTFSFWQCDDCKEDLGDVV